MFYMKPPRGEIHLEKAGQLASKRIRFLSIIGDRGQFDLEAGLQRHRDLYEAVAENTPKDRVAHYFLRIASALGDSWGLKEYFLRQESRLFELRSVKEGYSMLLQLQRHLREMLASSSCLDTDLKRIHGAVSEIIDEEVYNSRSNAAVRVPFRLAPTLVAKRLVDLEGGQAVIDSTAVKPFLTCVHQHFLAASLRSIAATGREMMRDDPRLQDLITSIASEFRAVNPGEMGAITHPPLLAAEVQSASAHFPPCFACMNQRLVRTRRLGHHARVAYTLFLKEVGLGYAEALKLWGHHYSRASTPSASVHWRVFLPQILITTQGETMQKNQLSKCEFRKKMSFWLRDSRQMMWGQVQAT